MVKRSYDTSGRREAARRTRQAILDAAGALFVEPGYAAARVADVAGAAGVAVPTVTAHFGSKRGLLSALLDVTIAGDDEPTALAQRGFVSDINALAGARAKIARYAEHLADTMARVAPVLLALESAATVEADAAAILAKNNDERLAGMTMLASELMATGEVRPELTLEDVASILVLAMDVRNYDWLVRRRGFSPDAFRDWYVRGVAGAVLARDVQGGSDD